MSQRLITVITSCQEQDLFDPVEGDEGELPEAIEQWQTESDNKRCVYAFLVNSEDAEAYLDRFRGLLEKQPESRIMVSAVEASLPHKEEEKEEENEQEEGEENGNGKPSEGVFFRISREELYSIVEAGAHLNFNHLAFVVLSTIVAAIALLNNNLAILIGAMVLTPLLGPNLALGFASVLGEVRLIKQSLKTGAAGLGLALVLSMLIGLFAEVRMDDNEVLQLVSEAGFTNILIALSAGVAAVLALAQPGSGSIVGVMVAVALLPPAVGFGLFVGDGEWKQAFQAAMILVINVVGFNLAAQLTFLSLRLRPSMQSWLEEERADQTFYQYFWIWSGALLVLLISLYWV